MILLHDQHYIAEGEIRKCYIHPSNKNLCIKIPKPEITLEYINKELFYFHKIRRKKNFDYLFFSNYRGLVETSRGKGYSFDLIRDENTNQISKTLQQYLEMDNSPFSDKILMNGLLRLKQQMIRSKIFTRDLRPRNVCCKILKNNSLELIIIDGIGHRDFFPFADWFHYFSKKKVNRSFSKSKILNFSTQRKQFKLEQNYV